jgi:hypothetical protein
MATTLPEIYRRGFVAIVELSQEQLEELLSVLKTQPLAINTTELESQITSKIDVPADVTSAIVETLVGNAGLKIETGGSASEVAEATVRAIAESSTKA